MTLTQYNTTVGHTGIARLCLAQKCYRTRTKLAEVGKPPPLQVGEDVTSSRTNLSFIWRIGSFNFKISAVFFDLSIVTWLAVIRFCFKVSKKAIEVPPLSTTHDLKVMGL